MIYEDAYLVYKKMSNRILPGWLKSCVQSLNMVGARLPSYDKVLYNHLMYIVGTPPSPLISSARLVSPHMRHSDFIYKVVNVI
jgi:hypothetical protein